MKQIVLEKESKRMFVLGLTGSIGMGKTTANYFRILRAFVYNSDIAVHSLLELGGGL